VGGYRAATYDYEDVKQISKRQCVKPAQRTHRQMKKPNVERASLTHTHTHAHLNEQGLIQDTRLRSK